MTSHKDHTHPNTAKARAACRKATAKKVDTIVKEMTVDAFPRHDEPAQGHAIQTPAGDVREGSTVEVLFRGDIYPTRCTVDVAHDNVKNERPGFDVTEVRTGTARWCYADQVTAITRF